MSVFTLPGFNTVFKIIKDRFSPSKNVDRATVIEKYRLVKASTASGAWPIPRSSPTSVSTEQVRSGVPGRTAGGRAVHGLGRR
jgi:hypothetical protein